MRAIIAMVVMAGVSAGLNAAGTTRPGLWEMSMKSDQMRQMPNVPPEQIEQMRRMGVEIPTMREGAMIQRVCITPEMASRNQTPDLGREPGDCKLNSHDRSGNTYRADIVCDGAQLKGNGTIKGTMNGDTGFRSTYDFKGTSRGQPVTQHHETQGKWLSADCGNVRPLGETMGGPKKK
jgi:hypothetical protein